MGKNYSVQLLIISPSESTSFDLLRLDCVLAVINVRCVEGSVKLPQASQESLQDDLASVSSACLS